MNKETDPSSKILLKCEISCDMKSWELQRFLLEQKDDIIMNKLNTIALVPASAAVRL